MRGIVKRKIISGEELSRLLAVDDRVTYDCIKEVFSVEDLSEYNRPCKLFVKLVGNRNNIEKWDMLSSGQATGLDLVSTLNRIEELIDKYSLPGTFYKVWRAKPLGSDRFDYDEVSW